MEIKLKSISNFILKDVDLKINDGNLAIVLGPNGAGKTTLLNVIAGLVNYEGEMYFNGKYVNGLPTQKRNVGYVFQDVHLFPHFSVYDNMVYGHKVQKKFNSVNIKKLNDLIDIMGINRILNRYPKNLSGGEKQKAALIRAVLPEPRILLLDEPLKNIDMETKEVFLKKIIELKNHLSLTFIYVTHNISEAELPGDMIIKIKGGRINEVVNI